VNHQRRDLLRDIEAQRASRAILYVTGDRPAMSAQISPEIHDYFVHHLDEIGVIKKISLILYTVGGQTLAAWTLSNLLRMYCDELEVIVPSKARSAGTLICLGANAVMMTKQATLGPIDPSVNTPLNPPIQGAGPTARFPVSVEDIGGYEEFVKKFIGNGGDPSAALAALTAHVHPLVLGKADRTRQQIRMLARRLLEQHLDDSTAIDHMLDFLCADSGSHDYTINRREAKSHLNLPVLKPTQEEYTLIKKLYDDFAAELKLTEAYDPQIFLGGAATKAYDFPRALIESTSGGSHAFRSRGILTRTQIPPGPSNLMGIPQEAITDNRQFEGWSHVDTAE